MIVKFKINVEPSRLNVDIFYINSRNTQKWNFLVENVRKFVIVIK